MTRNVRSMALAIGWAWVFVFVMIGVLGAGLHVLDQVNLVADRPTVADLLRRHIYGNEFFDHWLDFRNYPVPRMVHMVLGIIFVLIAPLQFVPRVRKAFPRLHRAIGRICLLMSIVLIATGWLFAFKYTYTGLPEQVPTVTYTLIYVWLIYMALKNIRAGNVMKHREWMARAFAMMMGISGTRVWFYVFLKATEIPSNQFFSSIFWLGLGVNLLIAEIWINLTRQAPLPARKPADQVAAARDQRAAPALGYPAPPRSETCHEAAV